MRLCANVPAMYAVQTALGGYQSINELIMPGGRLRDQRDAAMSALANLPGVSCVKPRGALYLFPKINLDMHKIRDDQQMVLDFLIQEKILLVQGTAFNWPKPDHFRIVFLPREDDLTRAINRFGEFCCRLEISHIKMASNCWPFLLTESSNTTINMFEISNRFHHFQYHALLLQSLYLLPSIY